MISKTCSYAVRIVVFLASAQKKEGEGVLIGLPRIAEAVGTPIAFTAKVMQLMVRNKLLRSVPGPHGGFCLPRDSTFTLLDVVRAIDGNRLVEDCFLGFERCSSDHPCPMHHAYGPIRERFRRMLEQSDLEDLADNVELALAHVKG